MARRDIAAQIAQLVGRQRLEVVDLAQGWPSLFRVRTETGIVPVAAHVSNVSPHARRDYEWRFQNPANRTPVASPPGFFPLLVGLDELNGGDVLVVADGRSRIGRVARFSILFDRRISLEALNRGWGEYASGAGETIFGVRPRLLPVLVDMLRGDYRVPADEIAEAVDISGLIEEGSDEAEERLRRSVSTFVRRAKFGRDVRAAYNGRCAFCGVALGLTAGAHIYPVSAPGSQDRVWNGIALCHNHHSAFDRHKIWVNSDFRVLIAPSWAAEAEGDEPSSRFVHQTRDEMILPQVAAHRPRRDMLIARYNHYAADYEWAPAFR